MLLHHGAYVRGYCSAEKEALVASEPIRSVLAMVSQVDMALLSAIDLFQTVKGFGMRSDRRGYLAIIAEGRRSR